MYVIFMNVLYTRQQKCPLWPLGLFLTLVVGELIIDSLTSCSGWPTLSIQRSFSLWCRRQGSKHRHNRCPKIQCPQIYHYTQEVLLSLPEDGKMNSSVFLEFFGGGSVTHFKVKLKIDINNLRFVCFPQTITKINIVELSQFQQQLRNYKHKKQNSWQICCIGLH